MPEELPDPVGAPEVPQPSVDWEKRYTDTHAEYNRLNEQLRRFESDPTAVVDFIRDKHPDLLAADEEDNPEPEYEPDTPVNDPRVDQHEKQLQQFAAWQAEQQYAADLKQEVGERELSAHAKRTIKSWTMEGGGNRESLQAAVKEWFELEESLRGPKPKPSAPTPPQPGRQGEPAFDPRDRKARRARFEQIAEGM